MFCNYSLLKYLFHLTWTSDTAWSSDFFCMQPLSASSRSSPYVAAMDHPVVSIFRMRWWWSGSHQLCGGKLNSALPPGQNAGVVCWVLSEASCGMEQIFPPLRVCGTPFPGGESCLAVLDLGRWSGAEAHLVSHRFCLVCHSFSEI